MNSFNFRSNNKNNQNRGDDNNPFFYRNDQGFDRNYNGNDGQGQFFSDNFYHNQDPYFSSRNFSPRDLPTVGHMQQFAHLRNYQNNSSDAGQQTFWGDEFSGSDNHIPKEETPSLLKLIIASTGLVVVVAVSWFVYKWVKEPTDTTPMLIKADQGPYKVRPDDPGGVNIPHQDKLIYGRLNKGNYYQEEGEVERLLPPQEEPEEEFMVNQNNYQGYPQDDNQNLDGDEYYPENYNQNNPRSETYNQNMSSNVVGDQAIAYQNHHQQNYHNAQHPSTNHNNNSVNVESGRNSGYVMTPPRYENQDDQASRAHPQTHEPNNFRQSQPANYNANPEGDNYSYPKQHLDKTNNDVGKEQQLPKQIIESAPFTYNHKTIDDVIEEKESAQQEKSDKKEKLSSSSSPKNEYYIQLGTLTTENDAVDEWNRLSKKHGLSNYRAVIKVTESTNGKKNYRLLMGPFSDKGKTTKHASKIGGGAKVIQIESK